MKRNKVLAMLCLVVFGLVVTGCTPKSDVETASINQVLGNQESLQENAFYHFDKGTLTVTINYLPFQNPTDVAKNSEDNEIIQGDLARFKKEFPNEQMLAEDLKNGFEKEFKNVALKIDKQKGELSLTGDGIHKVFEIFAENESRLIDEAKIEYEVLE